MTYPANASRHIIGQTDEQHRFGAPSMAPVTERRPRSPNRIYSVAWMGLRGYANYETITAPAIPVIENICASVARGALIMTEDGPVAIEDLEPGAMVMTNEYGPQPVQWIGSYDMTPREAQNSERARLYRVTADTFGLAKPSHDLMLASAGHILTRHAACQTLYGFDMAFAPIRGLEDGETVIAVKPMSPVSVYNIAFDKQATIIANGVEIESFHPGALAETLLDQELRDAIGRLFPHIRSLDTVSYTHLTLPTIYSV